MAGKRSSSRSTPKYSRSARVSTTLQEIIADELVRIDDERLTFVTVTGIDVDAGTEPCDRVLRLARR